MKKPTIIIDRSQDVCFMQEALQEAKKAAACGEVPVGAVVVYNGEIIGRGFNQPITTNDPSAHAEIKAIRQAAYALQNYRLINTTLYVTLEPCSMCAGLLIHSRIERLVYATAEPRAGAVISQDQFFSKSFLNHSIIVEGGILAEESSYLLKSFFKDRRLKQSSI